MSDYQVVAVPEDRGPRASREDAALRRLLRGTVFDPDGVASVGEEQRSAGEENRPATAHCRFAMYYVD